MADIVETTDANIEYAIPNFVTKLKSISQWRRFYYWNSIRYFLYEYETSLAQKNNIDRIGSWEMFTKTEKDKVSLNIFFPRLRQSIIGKISIDSLLMKRWRCWRVL